MPSANIPINRHPGEPAPRFGWPWLARAARPEPMAMPTVNTARHMVTTPSLPPTQRLDQGRQQRQRDEPTSQNQDTICAPPHRRASALSSRSSAIVEVQGLAVMARPGAAGPAAGISGRTPGGECQRQDDDRRRSGRLAGAATAMPPAMVPIRIARNVAPSTRALPAGSSAVASFSGRMPYLTGPNRAATTPNRPSATNRIGTECRKKPRRRGRRSGSRQSRMRCATKALS